MSLSPLKRFWLVAAVLVLLAVLLLFFYQQTPRYRWDQNYLASRRDPYSTHVLATLLEERVSEDRFRLLTDSLHFPPEEEGLANYVFIGDGLSLDSASVDKLLQFVREGNTAFIASRSLPRRLMIPLLADRPCPTRPEDFYGYTDSTVTLSLAHPAWPPEQTVDLSFRIREALRPYRWRYLSPAMLCEDALDPAILGTMEGQLANFVRLPLGRGIFLLHTNPLAFTNIALLEETHLAYAEHALSYLNDGPIAWDSWSKVSEAVARRRNAPEYSPPERRLDAESPLQYVLRQPALAWAWYLLLSLGLLHLIFRTKRRQRIQPAPEANQNTSLEFLDTISRLYLLQKDHKQMAMLQTKLFRAHIHREYELSSHDIDAELMDKLATRSKAPPEKLDRILKLYQRIAAARKIDEKLLLRYHRALEAFYRQGGRMDRR